MTYTGNEDHSISLQDASEMTENYRNTISAGGTIAHFFGKKIIHEILNQEGCVGIRIYYAINEQDKKKLVITGVNSNGDDLYNGILADRSLDCPSYCSASNPLNT